MGRLTPMTTRMAEFSMELYAKTLDHLSADGVLCEGDQMVLMGIKRLGALSEVLDRSRRAARTLEDAGEMTPHAERLLRETQRDLAPILALSPNYPRCTGKNADTV